VARVCWQAKPDGRYWIDVVVGNQVCPCLIDLGLVDPLDQIGLALRGPLFQGLEQAGLLAPLRWRLHRDASGQTGFVKSGETNAQLSDPLTQGPVGPTVRLFVCRGAPGVPDRVGVTFFHRLKGCGVSWDFDTRTWCVLCP